jgi:hypothetical protein
VIKHHQYISSLVRSLLVRKSVETHVMLNKRLTVNDELERIWEEPLWLILRYFIDVDLEEI